MQCLQTVFMHIHPKGAKMSHVIAAKWKSFRTKTIDDLPDRGATQEIREKDEKRIFILFFKNPVLTM